MWKYAFMRCDGEIKEDLQKMPVEAPAPVTNPHKRYMTLAAVLDDRRLMMETLSHPEDWITMYTVNTNMSLPLPRDCRNSMRTRADTPSHDALFRNEWGAMK
jgi:hypothetical protein